MKTTAFITTLAALAASVTANKNCNVQSTGTNRYLITTDTTVPDISGICGGLWDNLKGFSACSASATSCGAVGQDNLLHWDFTVPSICNAGDVESAWYSATKNQYGSIDCGN